MILKLTKILAIYCVLFSIIVTSSVSFNSHLKIVHSKTSKNELLNDNLNVSRFITYNGNPAAAIGIPKDLIDSNIKVNIKNNIHNLKVKIINNEIILYEIKPNVTYSDIILKLHVSNSSVNENINFKINSFSYKTFDRSNINTSSYKEIENNPILYNYLKNAYSNIYSGMIKDETIYNWMYLLNNNYISLEDFFKKMFNEKSFLSIFTSTNERIYKIYAGIFQRQPDKDGLNFWINKYNAQLSKYGNPIIALKNIVNEITNGSEFKKILNVLNLNA